MLYSNYKNDEQKNQVAYALTLWEHLISDAYVKEESEVVREFLNLFINDDEHEYASVYSIIISKFESLPTRVLHALLDEENIDLPDWRIQSSLITPKLVREFNLDKDLVERLKTKGFNPVNSLEAFLKRLTIQQKGAIDSNFYDLFVEFQTPRVLKKGLRNRLIAMFTNKFSAKRLLAEPIEIKKRLVTRESVMFNMLGGLDVGFPQYSFGLLSTEPEKPVDGLDKVYLTAKSIMTKEHNVNDIYVTQINGGKYWFFYQWMRNIWWNRDKEVELADYFCYGFGYTTLMLLFFSGSLITFIIAMLTVGFYGLNMFNGIPLVYGLITPVWLTLLTLRLSALGIANYLIRNESLRKMIIRWIVTTVLVVVLSFGIIEISWFIFLWTAIVLSYFIVELPLAVWYATIIFPVFVPFLLLLAIAIIYSTHSKSERVSTKIGEFLLATKPGRSYILLLMGVIVANIVLSIYIFLWSELVWMVANFIPLISVATVLITSFIGVRIVMRHANYDNDYYLLENRNRLKIVTGILILGLVLLFGYVIYQNIIIFGSSISFTAIVIQVFVLSGLAVMSLLLANLFKFNETHLHERARIYSWYDQNVYRYFNKSVLFTDVVDNKWLSSLDTERLDKVMHDVWNMLTGIFSRVESYELISKVEATKQDLFKVIVQGLTSDRFEWLKINHDAILPQVPGADSEKLASVMWYGFAKNVTPKEAIDRVSARERRVEALENTANAVWKKISFLRYVFYIFYPIGVLIEWVVKVYCVIKGFFHTFMKTWCPFISKSKNIYD